MASVVDICNSALAKIGEPPIVSLLDGTKSANACNGRFEETRDEMLRGHSWNFAAARAKLARLSGSPAFGFDHQFQLPADWLRAVSVHDNHSGRGEVPYRIEGRRILSDADDVYLRYIRRIDDPNDMPPDFREALAFKLASEFAVLITQSNTIRQQTEAGALQAIRRARATDGLEDYPESLPDGAWIDARH